MMAKKPVPTKKASKPIQTKCELCGNMTGSPRKWHDYKICFMCQGFSSALDKIAKQGVIYIHPAGQKRAFDREQAREDVHKTQRRRKKVKR
jgi:hypothetical protein